VRVVFDTNIFISALVIPKSLAEKAIFKIIEGKDSLLVSDDFILTGYRKRKVNVI
jgi:predicted nucleic acid-binding protein